MEEFTVNLTDSELHRYQTIKNVVDKLISTSEAAKILKLSQRQVQRLKKRYLVEGITAFISKKRGRRSNRAFPEELKSKTINIIKSDYYDFGPTFAAENLAERNDIHICRETARQWMIEAEIWRPNIKNPPRPHPPRERRACFGELVHIDGSDHDWFEDRAPRCTLLVFIDDATSQILKLLMVQCESTLNYFAAMKEYFLEYGKPLNTYTDKHVVFRVNHPNAKSGNGHTQYTRALKTLNIEPIYAHSPQAKGRVERANSTLQDRLVKELRLENISTIDDANKYLEKFRKKYNHRFAKPARSHLNVHAQLTEEEKNNLDIICSVQTTRTVSKDLLVRHNNILLQVEAPEKVRRFIGAKVLISENTDGKINILYQDKPLQFKVYNKTFKNGHILSDKEINQYLNKKMADWTPAKNTIDIKEAS